VRDVVEWDEYQGRMDAVDMVEVRARVTGYLQSVNFKDGAEVKQGDLLFVIDPRPYQAELDRTQADLQQAETKFELASNDFVRAQRLLKARAISEEEADSRSKAERTSVAAIESARASVEMAKLNMEYTRVTAPISGRIGRKLITEGNLVNGNQGQSTLLATIVSLDPIYCYFDADERAIIKYQRLAREGKGDNIRGGKMACELALADESGFPHRGLLDFVDNQVDADTGTLRVRGIFANPDRTLQPGFFARVRVPGSAKNPDLLIPDQAVGTDQGQKFVYVVNAQNTVEYKIVDLGGMIDGLRVVRQGLHSNDSVIVNGLMSVRQGAKVIPSPEAVTAAK
jgi:multidrug efflux system membrane fusion protein